MEKICLFVIFIFSVTNIYCQDTINQPKWMITAGTDSYFGYTQHKDFFRALFGFKFDDTQVQLKSGLSLNFRYFKFPTSKKDLLPIFIKSGVTAYVNKKNNFIWSSPLSAGVDYYVFKSLPFALNAELGARYFYKDSDSPQFSNKIKLEYGAGLKTGI